MLRKKPLYDVILKPTPIASARETFMHGTIIKHFKSKLCAKIWIYFHNHQYTNQLCLGYAYNPKEVN